MAQKDFEGSVIYKLHSGAGEKQDAELTVLFGNRKLKMLFKEKEAYDKNVLVVFLDSAIAYNVNFEEKTFRKNTLILNAPVQKPEKKMIKGYSTFPLRPENTGIGNLLGGMASTSSIVFYVADSLHYYIPTAFTGNKEVLMIQQNKIVLGAEIQINNLYSEDSASKNNIITAEAIEIKPMTINESEFLIPADFADRKDMTYTESLDSTVAVVDTVAVAPPPPAKKAVKKKPVKPSQPKSKSTPKAAIRKDT
jgi:hypothetical protein